VRYLAILQSNGNQEHRAIRFFLCDIEGIAQLFLNESFFVFKYLRKTYDDRMAGTQRLLDLFAP
jgi:hypothetical protein